MPCSICNHPQRQAIEEMLLVSNYGNETMTIPEIANKFKVSVQDLQVHALMHTPLVQLEGSEVGDSIASTVKKREANLLSAMADEYYVTLRALGKNIRTVMANDELGGAKLITKPMTDLYIGVGVNLRQTLESIVTMNQKVNGEQDSGVKALADIVNAIRGSSNP
jgi:hypothetical protein